MKLTLKILLLLMAVWIASVSLYPLLDTDRQSGVLKRLVTVVPWAGHSHIVFGSLALILGSFQLSSRLRRKSIRTHKTIGNAYVACVLLSTVGALAGLPFSKAPLSAWLGFLLLAIVWPIVTLAGYPWRGTFDFKWHGKLMIYSYALTCAAISLRLILIPLLVSGVPFKTAYPIAAWGGGIVNVIIAFFALRFVQGRMRKTDGLALQNANM